MQIREKSELAAKHAPKQDTNEDRIPMGRLDDTKDPAAAGSFTGYTVEKTVLYCCIG